MVVPSRQIRFAKRTRDLARGITVRNGSGHRLKSAARLRGADLVVTLRSSAVRSRIAARHRPRDHADQGQEALSGKHHGAAVLQSLTVTVTDVLSFRTAFSLR